MFPGGDDYVISSGTVNTCGGTFFDTGGPIGSYGNFEFNEMTFCSDDPDPNAQIVFDFISWDLENCCDFLIIYDGPNTSGAELFNGNGSSNPGTIISSTGCLTFVWNSDGSVTYTGWEAEIGCYIPPVLDCNGGDIVLTAQGQGTSEYVLFNDFDAGSEGAGWSTNIPCLLYTSPSPRDATLSRMPSSA